MKFNEKLTKLRKQNNLSQESLAEKLGMSRQAISKWESGSSYPDMSTMINICKVLNCTLEDLLDDDVIGTNDFKHDNKININKWINDLLNFITKSYNMFWSMKIIDKIKCILEMLFIIFTLYLISSGLGLLLYNIVFKIIDFLPNNIYSFLYNFTKTIYIIIALIISFIITIHLFKIRYLDYYITVEDKNVTTKQKEEEYNKNTKKEFTNNNHEKIIIRDPVHTPYSFFTALAHIILFFIKMFLILILIPLVFTFIFLIILLTLSILWFKYGFIFFGIFIGLIGAILINYIFINLIFNFTFNRKSNLLIIFIIFISGLFLIGLGSGISFYELSTFKIVENNYTNKTLEIKMNNDIILEDFDSSLVYIDNNEKNIKIDVEYLSNYDVYYRSSNNIYFIYDNITDFNVITDILNNIKKREIKPIYNDNIYNIKKITVSNDNYKKLLKNYNNYYLE